MVSVDTFVESTGAAEHPRLRVSYADQGVQLKEMWR